MRESLKCIVTDKSIEGGYPWKDGCGEENFFIGK